MESQSVRVFLELPGELVVMEVPKVEAQRRFLALDAVQMPFPPPYDSSGRGVDSSSNSYPNESHRTRVMGFYEVMQYPFPPPYDHTGRTIRE